MLVRDSVPRLRIFTSRHVRPHCLSRGYATRSLPATYLSSSLRVRNRSVEKCGSQGHHFVLHRSFATTRTHRATGASLASTTSPLDNSLLYPSGLGLESPEDVRAYLKKWSQTHQRSIRDNAPDQVQIERHTALPNSLFLRNSSDAATDSENNLNDDVEAADLDISPTSADDVHEVGTAERTEMYPGAALRINSGNGRIRSQLAIYLGNRDVQSLYLLADGRWFACCQHIFNSHIINGFATPAELSRIQAHLPQKTIEFQKAEDGAVVPFTAVGEIPHADSRHLVQKLATLNEEIDQAKRDYPSVCDKLYEEVADESEYKFDTLKNLLHERLHINVDTLTEGAKMYLYAAVWDDMRFAYFKVRKNQIVGFQPRKMSRSIVKVTQWARSYQDAAARAAIGKNVSEELSQNPLIPFISKARRLISKSRKIRLPTLECELGPTLEGMRPPPGTIERRLNDEEFTEDEKKIIEFLWVVYVKRPMARNAGGRRNLAVASLIIRAVGAYPKFTLDSPTGMLFLKELGCLDPWATPHDYLIQDAHTRIGLHQPARLAKEKSLAAIAALGMRPDQEELPFPDTLAHVRKDWGDLEVFCIDSSSTRVVDDGISVEPSQDFPGHHWVRVHIAHFSAFVPHDSPILAQAELMGASQYHLSGSEPYIPYEAVMPCNLGPNKPVLTISTLLSPEGSIKDIEITPGIIRNVVKIDVSLLKTGSFIPRSTVNLLKVGTIKPAGSGTSESEQDREQLGLTESQRASLGLLQQLVMSRWEARYRESPDHLKMLKLPVCKQTVYIHPSRAVRDPQYERIFRSEHVVGDLSVSVRSEVYDYDRVRYREQGIKSNPVAGAMMLASEATALWTSARGIPVLYRHTKESQNSSLSKLNNLGPHDFYIGLASGESVDMHKNLALSMSGYVHVTSPLRSGRDLINHYQIDAYLRAQAGRSGQLDGRSEEIQYPRSRQQLIEVVNGMEDGGLFAKHQQLQNLQWTVMTLYRAFYFQEHKLPEVLDVFINNPVSVGANSNDAATTCKGVLYALGLSVGIDPSKEGWEKMAKFRQYLPCKLTRIVPGDGTVHCIAVGPPSDEPSVKDLVYPEMQAE